CAAARAPGLLLSAAAGRLLSAAGQRRPLPLSLSAALMGRPSREEAERIGDAILDAATEMFLAEGYGATSIEALAQRLRISKRTFYHRFKDKAELFEAVVRGIVGKLK